MDELIANIQTEFATDNVDKAEVLMSYLSILLISAKRIYVSEDNFNKPMLVRNELTHKFKKLVDANYRQQKTVSAYAELLNISAGHLNDTVQKDIGKTASEIVYSRIILEAKRLLYHSQKSVKEIAADLMYDDPSYFTRFFKTHTQFTPEEFRKHIREKYH